MLNSEIIPCWASMNLIFVVPCIMLNSEIIPVVLVGIISLFDVNVKTLFQTIHLCITW